MGLPDRLQTVPFEESCSPAAKLLLERIKEKLPALFFIQTKTDAEAIPDRSSLVTALKLIMRDESIEPKEIDSLISLIKDRLVVKVTYFVGRDRQDEKKQELSHQTDIVILILQGIITGRQIGLRK